MGLQRVLPSFAHLRMPGRRDVPNRHGRCLVLSVFADSSDGDGSREVKEQVMFHTALKTEAQRVRLFRDPKLDSVVVPGWRCLPPSTVRIGRRPSSSPATTSCFPGRVHV